MEDSSSSSTERVTGSDRSTAPLACQTLARTLDRATTLRGMPGWVIGIPTVCRIGSHGCWSPVLGYCTVRRSAGQG